MNNVEAVTKWFQDFQDGRNSDTIYPLSSDSLVLDVGGYKGDWAETIVKWYNPYVWIFEPVEEFHAICVERFKDNPKVSVYNYGLSDRDEVQGINLSDDASAVCEEGTHKVTLKDVNTVIGSTSVDLISLNIEGGEYKVLPRMLESGSVKMCKHVQVQFHFHNRIAEIENCEQMRDEIRSALDKTHSESYCYPFVWESWKRR